MLIALRGEDEIRTRGTLETYVGLANRWFQPLTHLSRGTVPRVLSNLAFGPDCKDTKINCFAIGAGEKDSSLTLRMTRADAQNDMLDSDEILAAG